VSVAGQIAQVSRPFLQSLARDCRATAHLGVRDNDMVTYLVKASSSVSRSAKIFTKENFQLEAYCSGIGKVLLAWQPDIERERYLAGGPFVAITSNTITNPKDLRACLERVRNDGFAADDGEIAADLYCLAVPLVSRDRPIEAAISLSFNCPEGRPIQGDAYLDKLRASATRIAAKLWPSERLAPLHNEIAGS
jgi:DNA-binding IclR family transcriptional regulator